MVTKPENFQFYYVYEKAAVVEDSVYNNVWYEEIDWSTPHILQCLHSFSKLTILHHYIYTVIAIETRYSYLKYDKLDVDELEKLEDVFKIYDIELETFDNFIKRNNISEEAGELPKEVFDSWFIEQEDQFVILWELITEEVFQLLFANRTFLLAFHKGLADWLSSGELNIPHSYLSENGKLKRQSYIPAWVRKAVYFRDRGRCVLCQKDLSGLLSTDRQIHYDHIVPLHQWGTNDPSNLQLLCDECNLEKSGIIIKTSTRYAPWWSQDDLE